MGSNIIQYLFNMKKILNLFLLTILLPLFGCIERLTYQEFKERYDWAETSCVLNTSRRRCNFEYNGVNYSPIVRIPITYHNHFMILFDKNAPDQNFLVQLDKPVKPKTNMIVRTEGNIRYVRKWVNFVEIEYDVRTDVKRDIFFRYKEVSENWVPSRFDYLPLSYFDKLITIKDQKLLIPVDFYITEVSAQRFGSGSIFINREALDSLKI